MLNMVQTTVNKSIIDNFFHRPMMIDKQCLQDFMDFPINLKKGQLFRYLPLIYGRFLCLKIIITIDGLEILVGF